MEDPKFCAGFLDRCDQMALTQAPELIEIGRRAVELADASGDPHLLHRGHGVLSHAYVARGEYYWARKTLAEVRERALACCPSCRADYLCRVGDLTMEEGRLDDSLAALNRALDAARELAGDARGRIHFVRGVTHHLRGDRDRALADANATLKLTSLDSPRGLFVETAAFVAIYVDGGDPRHDMAASAMLAAFDQRGQGRARLGQLDHPPLLGRRPPASAPRATSLAPAP